MSSTWKSLVLGGLLLPFGCRSSDTELEKVLHLHLSMKEYGSSGSTFLVVDLRYDHAFFLGSRPLSFVAFGADGLPLKRTVPIPSDPDFGVPQRISVPLADSDLEKWLPMSGDYWVIAQIGPVDSNAVMIRNGSEATKPPP